MFAHLLIFTCIPAFLHVEHVGQDIVATELEEVGAEGQEQQLPEIEVADQAEEQTLETDFANPALQQGKPQFILNLESLHWIQVLFLLFIFMHLRY